MTVVHAAVRAPLVRLFLALAVGSTLAFILGLLYPVQRELDLARYEHASYSYEVEGVFPPTVSAAIGAAVGPRSCLVSVWVTVLRHAAREEGPTELDAVSPSYAQGVSRFPPATRLAGHSAGSRRWIDLNADSARALHVGPGDPVDVQVGPDLPPVRLTVRGVYAVRATGAAAAAMAPAEVLFAGLPAGAQAGYGLALTRTPPAEFLPRLSQDPLKRSLEAAKGYPLVVTATSARLAGAADASTHSLGLVRTVGALAVLGVAGLVVRELDVFRRQCLPAAQLVHRLGGPAPRLIATLLGMASLVAVGATTGGLLLAYAAYRFGVVASCFPPTLRPLLPWVSLSSAALPLAYVVTAAPLACRRLALR